MPEDSPHQFGAEVTVTLRDGRVLSRRIDDLIGRGGDNPMTGEELWEKFSDCSKRAIGTAMRRDRDSQECGDRQQIGRRLVAPNIAEHGGDDVRRMAVGHQHDQRLGVIDTAVAVENESPVRHG